MIPRALPFEFVVRGNQLARMDGQELAAAQEQRDRDLEDFLAAVVARIEALETEVFP